MEKLVEVSLSPDIVEALAEWCAAQSPELKEAESISYLLRDSLTALGILDLPPPKEDAN